MACHSLSHGLPLHVYCDAAPGSIAINQVQAAVRVELRSDEEYSKLQADLVEKGVEVIGHAPFAPWRTGRVELCENFKNAAQVLSQKLGNTHSGGLLSLNCAVLAKSHGIGMQEL